MKRRHWLLLLLLLLPLLAAGLVWRARTAPQVGEAIPFAQLPPEEQARRREDAARLREDIKKVARAARSSNRQPFKVVASQQQLNTLLQDSLRTEKFEVRDLRVGLQPEELALQGTVNHKGMDVVVTLTGNVVVEHNKLAFQMKTLRLAGLPAPRNLHQKVETLISQRLNHLLKDVPGQITRVALEQQQLTIEGVPE